VGEGGGESGAVNASPARSSIILLGTKGKAWGERGFSTLRSSAVPESVDIAETFVIARGEEIVEMIGTLGTKTSASGERINFIRRSVVLSAEGKDKDGLDGSSETITRLAIGSEKLSDTNFTSSSVVEMAFTEHDSVRIA